MTSPGKGSLRLVRGLILSLTCLAMSLGAHAAAGGAVHVSPGLVIGGLALSAMCVAAAESRHSFRGICSVILLSQLGLHLFAGAGGHHAESAVLGLTAQMVAYHVVAAIVVAGLLAHGERLIWALWSLARPPQVPIVGESVPATGVPVVRGGRDVPDPVRPHFCVGCLATRAPPVAG